MMYYKTCASHANVTHGMELFDSSSPTIKHCLITANGQTGIIMHQSTGRGTLLCKPVIENCIIVKNGEISLVGGEPVIIDSIVE